MSLVLSLPLMKSSGPGRYDPSSNLRNNSDVVLRTQCAFPTRPGAREHDVGVRVTVHFSSAPSPSDR